MTTSKLALRAWLIATLSAAPITGCLPPPYQAPDEHADDADDGDDDDDTPFPNKSRLNRENDGYPDEIAGDYGFLAGDVLQNQGTFDLRGCDGKKRSFKSLLQATTNESPDGEAPDGYWKGAVIALGAGWCGACKEEAQLVLGPVAKDYAKKGIRLLHILYQTQGAGAPDTATCKWWDESVSGETYPVWYDKNAAIYDDGFKGTAAMVPILIMIDANANIRFRTQQPIDAKTLARETKEIIERPYGP